MMICLHVEHANCAIRPYSGFPASAAQAAAAAVDLYTSVSAVAQDTASGTLRTRSSVMCKGPAGSCVPSDKQPDSDEEEVRHLLLLCTELM
jgi:hypothetical protein